MDQKKIGRFIALCRKERNLTQEQVAEKLGVSNKTVSRWENGNSFPDVSLLQPLCELLGISVNELLEGEKIPENNYRKRVEESTLRILEECGFALENGQLLKSNEKTINLGFFGVVAIVFTVLKLTGTITWPWIWVLSPLWIGLVFGGVIAAVVLIIIKKRIWEKNNWKWKLPRIKIKFF